MIALPLALAAFAFPLAAARANKPPVTVAMRAKSVSPFAVAPGFAGKVVVRGLRLDAATEVTADGGVTVKFVGKPRKSALPNGPPGSAGDTEAEVELTVPKDFAAPHVALKVGTADAVKLLVVPGLVAEKEPNNGFATAQAVTVPLALHGTIEKPRDVDVYRFTGRKGERLRIQITARNLGSLLDATVTLYDENRRIVESCDDVGGDTDPSFPVVLPRDGVYYLSVIDSHDLGGPGFAYLLSVTK